MKVCESIANYEHLIDSTTVYVVFIWERPALPLEFQSKYPPSRNLRTCIMQESRDFFEVFNWALENAQDDPFQIFVSQTWEVDDGIVPSRLMPLFGADPTFEIV